MTTPRAHGLRTVVVVVLGASCVFALASPALAAPDDDVSALLLQKTQAFSDAGQRGDGAAMAPMLDDRVVFFNEGGDSATKAEISAPGSPPAPGVAIRMTVTDWNCQVHGDVAVASFIDDQLITAAGETTHAKYRSVETWMKEAGAWKMIGSQTLALQDDPTAVALSPATLDEYVGRYRSAVGTTFTFTRKGDELFGSVGDGPAALQMAEVRDVFFTPGRARIHKVFQRDGAGHVNAFAYRREGHDTIYRRMA